MVTRLKSKSWKYLAQVTVYFIATVDSTVDRLKQKVSGITAKNTVQDSAVNDPLSDR